MNFLWTLALGVMLITAVVAIIAGFIALLPYTAYATGVVALVLFVYLVGAAVKDELGIR